MNLLQKEREKWAKQQFQKVFSVESGLGPLQTLDVKAPTELALKTVASATVAVVQQISPCKQATTVGPTESAPTNEF